MVGGNAAVFIFSENTLLICEEDLSHSDKLQGEAGLASWACTSGAAKQEKRHKSAASTRTKEETRCSGTVSQIKNERKSLDSMCQGIDLPFKRHGLVATTRANRWSKISNSGVRRLLIREVHADALILTR